MESKGTDQQESRLVVFLCFYLSKGGNNIDLHSSSVRWKLTVRGSQLKVQTVLKSAKGAMRKSVDFIFFSNDLIQDRTGNGVSIEADAELGMSRTIRRRRAVIDLKNS